MATSAPHSAIVVMSRLTRWSCTGKKSVRQQQATAPLRQKFNSAQQGITLSLTAFLGHTPDQLQKAFCRSVSQNNCINGLYSKMKFDPTVSAWPYDSVPSVHCNIQPTKG